MGWTCFSESLDENQLSTCLARTSTSRPWGGAVWALSSRLVCSGCSADETRPSPLAPEWIQKERGERMGNLQKENHVLRNTHLTTVQRGIQIRNI